MHLSNSDTQSDFYDFEHSRFEYPTAEHLRTDQNDRRVRILIRDSSDVSGPGMTFEVRYLDDFKNAFDQFKNASCKICRAIDAMRFKMNGSRIISASDTPKKLNLIHKTTTEIRVWSDTTDVLCAACRVGGFPKTKGAITAAPLTHAITPTPAFEKINIEVKDQTGFQATVKMSNTMPMKSLMETYATRAMRDIKILRFFFDGERLCGKETPKQLKLVNNDIIDVFIEQLGG